MYRLRPFGSFLCCYLPGLALAVTLGRLAAPRSPVLAPLILVSVGFLAFAIAVSMAAAPAAARKPPGRVGPVIAVLAIRRHRGRHAAGFALLGAAGGAAAISAGGAAAAPGLAASHLALSFAILFVAAWIIIGEAACSQEAIRRALLGEIERTGGHQPCERRGRAAATRASASIPAQSPAATFAFGATQLPPTQSTLPRER